MKRKYHSLFFFLFVVLAVQPVSAEVYKWIDDKGNVHYGDKKFVNENSPEQAEDVSGQLKITVTESGKKKPEKQETENFFSKWINERFNQVTEEQKEQMEKQSKKVNACVKLQGEIMALGNKVQTQKAKERGYERSMARGDYDKELIPQKYAPKKNYNIERKLKQKKSRYNKECSKVYPGV